MVSPKVWKLAAIPIGLALAGVPAAAVHFWLSHYIEQEGIKELNVSAKRVIALTEARLSRVVEALDDLAARGVTSCTGADRDAMHEMSFRATPIKEVSLVDPDGDTVCTNLALPFGQRQVDFAADRKRAQRNHHRGHPARRGRATMPCAFAATSRTARGSPRSFPPIC